MTATVDDRSTVLTTGGVLRSEWLKLVTVRSTYWTTAVALLLALLIDLAYGGFVSPDRGSDATPQTLLGATGSLSLVALVVGVLGILSIGGEYATLQIRSSYTAVPNRWPALVAKGAVVGAWSFVLGLVVTFGGFGLIALLLAGKGATLAVDGASLGSLLGGALYLAVIAVFSVGLGALVRSSAAGITILTAILFVAPIVLALFGALARADWATDVSHVLLSQAGGVLFAVPGSAVLALWGAWIALVCWIAAAWTPALVLTLARDV